MLHGELSFVVEAEEQTAWETNMSHQEQLDGKPAKLQLHQNPQVAQTNEVVVDDAGAQATYSNFCRVTATPEEVILDFGLNMQPFATEGQVVKANHRIVMNFYTTKRLLAAIGMTIQRHEQTFGSIELDVRRRATSLSQQQPSAPTLLGPAGQPDTIKLS
jgi:Protein of unknown function (DUF3467)